MIKNAKNKKIEQPMVINRSDKPEKVLYHFAGSGQYFPMAIYARSMEDAQRIWNKKKVPYDR